MMLWKYFALRNDCWQKRCGPLLKLSRVSVTQHLLALSFRPIASPVGALRLPTWRALARKFRYSMLLPVMQLCDNHLFLLFSASSIDWLKIMYLQAYVCVRCLGRIRDRLSSSPSSSSAAKAARTRARLAARALASRADLGGTAAAAAVAKAASSSSAKLLRFSSFLFSSSVSDFYRPIGRRSFRAQCRSYASGKHRHCKWKKQNMKMEK